MVSGQFGTVRDQALKKLVSDHFQTLADVCISLKELIMRLDSQKTAYKKRADCTIARRPRDYEPRYCIVHSNDRSTRSLKKQGGEVRLLTSQHYVIGSVLTEAYAYSSNLPR
jgi:hypothetical protein